MKQQRHDHKDIPGLPEARNKGGQVITAEEFNEALENTVIREPDAIKEHTRIGNDPVYWEMTARGLFAAGKTITGERERVKSTLPDGPMTDITMTNWVNIMLTALGIECLIKAIWILQGNQLARDGKYVGMAKNERHDLGRLCHIARIPLDDRETDTLQRMSDIAQSIGRYPVGKSYVTRVLYWTLKDDDVIEDFVARLKAQFRRMRYPDDSRLST
jgi:hypothetical protein